MDSKFYIFLEAARLLKEKGYNEECEQIIKENGETLYGYNVNYKLPVTLFSYPTKAEAIDWLESNTGFIISEDRRCDGFWYYVIFQGNDIYYDSDCFVDGSFLTRWEAEEAAIIKVCKLLENGN